MGKTHTRSDVIEYSAGKTASFTYGTYKRILVNGIAYVISGKPGAFSKAGIHAAATLAAGVSQAASIPRGSLFLNASSGINASQGVYVKFAPATWAVVTTGSRV